MTPRGRAVAVLVASIAAGAGALAPPARAQEVGDVLVKKASRVGDQWLAGYTVDVHGVVDGDLTAVGIQAGLDGSVKGDVNLAGLRVRVGGIVGDDARALGAHVVVQGSVADALLVAGGDVEVTRNTFVGGTAMIAGRRLALRGDFHGDLHAAGASVELDGEVHRSATLRSDDVTLGPRARVVGELVVRGDHPPRISEGARIEGRVVHLPPPATGLQAAVVAIAGAVLFQLGMLAVAGAWLVLAPGLGRAAASLRLRRMGLPEAMGASAVVALPLVAVLAAATGFGIPVALGAAAAWLLLLLAAWSTSAVALGERIRRRLRPGAAPVPLAGRIGWTFGALLLLRAVAALPVAGWAATAAALLLGAAGVGRATWDGPFRRRGGREEG